MKKAKDDYNGDEECQEEWRENDDQNTPDGEEKNNSKEQSNHTNKGNENGMYSSGT